MEITSEKIKHFRTLFKGREDVFAVRWEKTYAVLMDDISTKNQA